MKTFLIILAFTTQTARPTEKQRFERAAKFNTCAGFKMLITFPNGDEIIQRLDSWSLIDGRLRTSSDFSGQKIKSLVLIDDDNYSIYSKRNPGTISKLDFTIDDCSNEPATLYHIQACSDIKCPESYHFMRVA